MWDTLHFPFSSKLVMHQYDCSMTRPRSWVICTSAKSYLSFSIICTSVPMTTPSNCLTVFFCEFPYTCLHSIQPLRRTSSPHLNGLCLPKILGTTLKWKDSPYSGVYMSHWIKVLCASMSLISHCRVHSVLISLHSVQNMLVHLHKAVSRSINRKYVASTRLNS
jgi:hypothetical protein